jgi:hypothetical protein
MPIKKRSTVEAKAERLRQRLDATEQVLSKLRTEHQAATRNYRDALAFGESEPLLHEVRSVGAKIETRDYERAELIRQIAECENLITQENIRRENESRHTAKAAEYADLAKAHDAARAKAEYALDKIGAAVATAVNDALASVAAESALRGERAQAVGELEELCNALDRSAAEYQVPAQPMMADPALGMPPAGTPAGIAFARLSTAFERADVKEIVVNLAELVTLYGQDRKALGEDQRLGAARAAQAYGEAVAANSAAEAQWRAEQAAKQSRQSGSFRGGLASLREFVASGGMASPASMSGGGAPDADTPFRVE